MTLPRTRFQQDWIYEIPRDQGETLLLDNERVVSAGHWYGKLGDPYIAYACLPRRDRTLEKALIINGIIKSAVPANP